MYFPYWFELDWDDTLGWHPPDTILRVELLAVITLGKGTAEAPIKESCSNKFYYMGVGRPS